VVHRWDVSPKEAVKIQKELNRRVITNGEPEIRIVAGADVSVTADRETMTAAVCLMTFPDLDPLEKATAKMKTAFPYVPGLLSFREGPVLLKAFGRLKKKPDLIIFDGQGIAHPRRFGIAAHMGVLLGIPSVGCAKSPLYGSYEPVAGQRGQKSLITDKDGSVLGACLRTRTGVKPVFISVGNLVSLDYAVDVVLECAPKYRLPEPVRCAHKLAGSV